MRRFQFFSEFQARKNKKEQKKDLGQKSFQSFLNTHVHAITNFKDRGQPKTTQGQDKFINFYLVLNFIKQRQYRYQKSNVQKLIQLWVSSFVQTYARPCNITLHQQMTKKTVCLRQNLKRIIS